MMKEHQPAANSEIAQLQSAIDDCQSGIEDINRRLASIVAALSKLGIDSATQGRVVSSGPSPLPPVPHRLISETAKTPEGINIEDAVLRYIQTHNKCLSGDMIDYFAKSNMGVDTELIVSAMWDLVDKGLITYSADARIRLADTTR